MILSALLAALLIASAHADPAPELRKVDLITANPKAVYVIAQGEITPKTALVKRVEIGKGSAIITYSNTTPKVAKPKFHLRLFNAYGMEIARVRVSWSFDSLKPGELKQETEKFYVSDLKPVFEHTGLALPSDWDQAVYAWLEGEAL